MVTKTNQNNNFKKIIYPGGEYVGGEAGEGMTIIPGVKPPKGSIRIPEKFARGSGGGGRAPSAPSAADIARRRAEEEARRRAEEEARKRAEEEARRKAEQEQKERQERIAAGKITGQLKPGQAVMEPFDPLKTALPSPTKRELGIETGFFEQVKEFVGHKVRKFFNEQTIKDLQRELSGDVGIFIGEGKGLRQTLDPSQSELRGTRTDIGIENEPPQTIEQRIIQEAIIAGGAGTPVEFIAQDIAKETSSNFQEQLNRKAESIQNQIREGKITLEEGEKKLKEEQEILQKKAQEIFLKKLETDPRIKRKLKSEADLRSLKEMKRGTDISPVLEIGALVGTSLIAPITTGAIISTSSGAMAQKEYGKAILGEQLSLKERGVSLLKGSLGVGLAATGTSAAFRTLEKQMTRIGIEDILAKKTRIYGRELIKTKKGVLLDVRGIKGDIKGARLITKQRVPIFETSKKPIYGVTESGKKILLQKGEPLTFSITGGKGISELRYFDYGKGKFVTKKVPFGLFGKGRGGLGARLVTGEKDIIISEKLTGYKTSFGTGGLIIDKKIFSIRFGGVSKKIKGGYKIISGKVTKGRIGILTGKKSIIADIEGAGFIKSAKDSFKDIDKFIISSRAGKGVYSASVKQQQALGLSSIGSITQTTTKITGKAALSQVIKQTTKPTIITSAIVSRVKPPTKQILKKPTETKIKQILTPILKPQVRTKQRLIKSQVLKPISITKQKQESILIQSQPQIQKQKLKIKQLFELKQITTTPPTPITYDFIFDYGIPKPLFPPITPLPKFKRGKPKKAQRGKQPSIYQPSFTAVVFKIRGKSRKLGRIGYNPLQIRGL